jgi:RNA polymerase sigma factor (sigma-70 family)
MGPDRAIEHWRLVEEHLPQVRRLARTFRGLRVSTEDLAAEGVLGLFEAASRFDPLHGVKFSTYASWWILKRMRESLAANASIVRLPRHRREDGAPRPSIRDVSLEEPARFGSTLSLHDVLAETSIPLPDEQLVREDGRLRVEGLLGALPPRHREVLERRFGLDGRHAEPLATLASEFGLSRERIHQIEREAIERLRRLMRRRPPVAPPRVARPQCAADG